MASELQGATQPPVRCEGLSNMTEQRDIPHEGVDSKQTHVFSQPCAIPGAACRARYRHDHSMDMLSESDSESEVSPDEISDAGC